MRLSHNMYSLAIYRTYGKNVEDASKASNNISTGKKINSAKDNPGKIGQNELLKIQVLANDAANKNIQDTNSMIQTFDGAMQEINNNLARLKELTVNSGDGSLSEHDKSIIQDEIDAVTKDIDYISNNTDFNGVKLSDPNLLDNNSKIITGAIGSREDEKIDIPIYNIGIKNLGIDSLKVDTVGVSIESVDKAIETVSEIRSKYGALQLRLEGSSSDLDERTVSIEGAQSNIGDADVAREMMEYTKSQILIQSSIGLMAQSNNFPQDALQILANVK